MQLSQDVVNKLKGDKQLTQDAEEQLSDMTLVEIMIQAYTQTDFHEKVKKTNDQDLIKGFEFIYFELQLLVGLGTIEESKEKSSVRNLGAILKRLKAENPKQFQAVNNYLKDPQNMKEFSSLLKKAVPERFQDTGAVAKSIDKEDPPDRDWETN